MAKNEWGVCRYVAGSVPEVLEAFVDRQKCANALVKRRETLTGDEKWEYMMLPLDRKGNGLLPPGVK